MSFLWYQHTPAQWHARALTVGHLADISDLAPGAAIAATRQGTALLVRPGIRARVNGEPVLGGLWLLEHRDEILVGGVRLLFSAESAPVVAAFSPGEGKRLPVCPVCRGPVKPGMLAVECPGCGRWCHQLESRACWTYAPTCRFCNHPTALSEDAIWRPGQGGGMTANERLSERTVLVAGLGNIGSHLPALLLQAGVGCVRLVDRDTVETKNLAAQDYRPEDVGAGKARALAARLRQRFPGRQIEAVSADLEDMPAGYAAADLILGALDSRRARQVLISELAWPLGVPVADGGVGDAGLGRVQVFVPGERTACLECTWGQADYRLLASEYPCVPGAAVQTAATGTPAYLGAFTASLMVREALRVLGGGCEESYEIAFDIDRLVLRRFNLKRASRCRHGHLMLSEVIPAGQTVADLLAAVQERFGDEPVRLQVRRGLGRFLTREGLQQHASERLSERGFVPGDRIRVSGPGQEIWLSVAAGEERWNGSMV